MGMKYVPLFHLQRTSVRPWCTLITHSSDDEREGHFVQQRGTSAFLSRKNILSSLGYTVETVHVIGLVMLDEASDV